MRWFWLFILALVLVTAGLYTKRVRTNAVVVAVPHGTPERVISTPREKPIVPTQSAEPKVQEQIEPEPEPEPEPMKEERVEEPELVVVAEPEVREFVVGPLIDILNKASNQASKQAASQAEKQSAELAASEPDSIETEHEEPEIEQVESEPTYELRSDGSFFVFATQSSVVGEGTIDLPFEVEWDTLRSVERTYNPKKGMDQLPDWLDLLDGKIVRIIGNTLVPVIATTTRELLVMKNPWDGCCIGVPPSPYDAIEVSLSHDVDFGSSAVGYGTVTGVFVLDPYVVDGWVLGLYMIDDATYRSGEGIAFPDF